MTANLRIKLSLFEVEALVYRLYRRYMTKEQHTKLQEFLNKDGTLDIFWYYDKPDSHHCDTEEGFMLVDKEGKCQHKLITEQVFGE